VTRIVEFCGTMTNPIPSEIPACPAADVFRLVVEAAPHALLLADAEGRILLVNARAEALFGYTRAEMLGQPVEMLMPERFRAAHREHRAVYGKHPEERREGRGRDFFVLRKDGSEVPVEIGLNPVETPEGALTLTTIIDSTERMQTHAAMVGSELRYRRLFESAKDGILILNADTGMVVDVNPFLVKLLGYSHEQFLGKAIWELGFFKDVVANEDKFAELRENEYVRYEDLPLETSDGRRIEVEFVSNVYLVNGGRVIQCNIRDITERKRAERTLEVSKARFAAVFRSNLAAIGIHTLSTGRVVDVNECLCEFSGWKREEIIGKTIFELETWVDVVQREAVMAQVAARGLVRDAEVRLRRRNGEVRDILLSVERLDVPGETEPVLVSMFTDLTERKRAETELLESKRFLRSTLDALSSHIAILDEHGTIIEVNAAWSSFASDNHFMGSSHGVGDNYLEVCDAAAGGGSEDAAAVAKGIHEVMVGRCDGFQMEYPCHSTVEKRWFNVRVTCFDDEGPVRVVVAHENITARKRAGDRFRRLVESNAQGVFFWGVNGAITGANDAFLGLTGYSRADVADGLANWVAMTPPDFVERDRRSIAEVAARGVCTPYEKEYIRKDGTLVPVFIGVANFEDSPEEGVCFVLDLTERKKLEQQFLRAQRMEGIGTLAGGIAHDLNNVLSPIMMSLEVLRMRFPGAENREMLDILSASAERGADMVRQVLSFARGVEGRRMEVQIKHVIQDIAKIARETFLKNIQVRTNVPKDLWTVMGDPTQLHQVLLNLCVNARDAMPNGGKLTISAENVTLDAHYAGLNIEARPGPYVFVEVEDNGCGIPPGIMEKIFDPFFTTKEVGKGTGLGLSTSLAIVKSHGGFIRVYSEMGKGTKFHINLPARTAESAAEAVERTAALPLGNGELILVVDDEESVRTITRQTLEAFGYRVVLASEGTEAVAIYAKRRAEIAAVLTDMTMPVMDGLATIQVLRKINPAVRIIAASGLTANSQLARFGVKHFLPKPYTAETLLKALKEVLSAP
jgi:PAS domain S-box-containing protein